MTAHRSFDKPLPAPPLPPRNQSTESSVPLDDTKDPHFLHFFTPTQQDAGPSRQNTMATAAPAYTPEPDVGFEPADTGTWSSTTPSDAPTLEEIADIKLRSLITSEQGIPGDSASIIPDESDPSPRYSDDVVVPPPEFAAAADEAGAEAAVEATATATEGGNIQVEIDVRDKSRFRDDLQAMGLDLIGSKEGDGGWRKAWSRRGSKKGDVKEDENGAGPSSLPGTPKDSLDGSTTGSYLGHVPVMNIVIFIVGSRGDVQPYISLALALIIHGGHRVRIATHPDFREFVLSANSRLGGKAHEGLPLEGRLEFFNAGGDPKELMAYMVKNPGLMPGFESLINGDIKRKKQMSAEYLRGFYLSTFSPDLVSGREFAADAIISNPPAFAHIHVAEALGIPLLMSFTMPWTATTAFPHPLVNVKKSNADQWATNWMGYHLADMLIWEGLGNVINTFRTQILRLPRLPDSIAPSVLDNLKIPWTYCWSPELLPKPKEWKGHIDVSGFYFLDGDTSYVPPAELAEFLAGGQPPVYIGFGSVVIEDPEKMTELIVRAVEDAGVRAILSAGWAGLGKNSGSRHKDIFVLTKDCPHEWLFAENRVSAVCHHGGAGTTACGVRHGRPTIIVPFFGDQKFWGDSVHGAGAGPAPIPIKTLTIENLTLALQSATSEEVVTAAAVLGEKIREEKGEEKGVASFGRHLPLHDMWCEVDPRKVAAWWCSRLSLRLSVEAAAALISAQKILMSDLTPHRSREYELLNHNMGPLGGTSFGIGNLVSTTFSATGQIFYSPVRGSVKLFYGVPEASLGVVADMFEGFDNIPRLMGSTVRQKGQVTDWKSGFIEGGKSLGFGLWDGITGLVTEPVDGAIREGAAGFGKGIGRGFANLMSRPTAGALGIFVLPTRGIKASIRSTFGNHLDPHAVLRGPKEALTKEAMRDMSPHAKEQMLSTFSVLEAETAKRRKQRAGQKWFLIASKKERAREAEEKQRKAEAKAQKREEEKRRAELQDMILQESEVTEAEIRGSEGDENEERAGQISEGKGKKKSSG